ncbi:hypothetical protein CDG76_08145 [Nostoc sp. 'Peltigera membranacea cyanobiont' 210A]|nr:hypothetical protein [Nostoc sp. 'Peltigera membranacea cyanobiont' 210A]OYD96729.1 hypothetical protein CDG76_08145 [Nostoc sp. 'Peltigera membranacea cyanobiont' 210A]
MFRPHQDKLRHHFRDEALRLALCRHPHIVQVENVFDEENLPCMAMEYIEGEDLECPPIAKGGQDVHPTSDISLITNLEQVSPLESSGI